MKSLLIMLALLLALPVFAAPAKSAKAVAAKVKGTEAATGYRDLDWDELVPKSWDPAKPFRDMNLSKMKDGDPKAMRVLEIMKKEWDNAPIDASLEGSKVRIPGFVVPIEETRGAVKEFLLVPYFGACIHVPPPPSNQIIHVISDKPIRHLRVMDAVWVTGELKIARYAQPVAMGMGASGYQINSIAVIPYKEEAIITMTPSR